MSNTYLPFPENKYKVIYADPPWQYRNKKTGGTWNSAAEQKYSTMSTEEICNLPVKGISDKDCVIFLWSTVPFLHDAFHVLEAWGFEYKTMLTWHKTSQLGLGYWFRGQTEHLLIGIKGNIKAFRSQQHNIIQLPVLSHSTKPREFRNLISSLTTELEPKIELFARERIDGWDSWGKDVPYLIQKCLI